MPTISQMKDPRNIVGLLIIGGMTELEISAALKKLGVSANQSTIHKIKSGATKRTNYDIGTGLARLYEQRKKRARLS